MKIISLSSSIAGPACAVSVSIKKYFYNNNYKTNIFDYLEISLKSITKILEENNEILKQNLNNNIEIYLNKNNNYSIIFKNYDNIISHHDLIYNYDTNDYNNLIEKYSRRYNRLIEYILNEDKIFFIRYGYENIDDINNFVDIIHKLNSKLIIYFINIIYDENIEYIDYKYTDINNYIFINLFKYLDNTIKYNDDIFYKTIQLNWKVICNIINENVDNEDKILFTE
jgi:hypothetical protein